VSGSNRLSRSSPAPSHPANLFAVVQSPFLKNKKTASFRSGSEFEFQQELHRNRFPYRPIDGQTTEDGRQTGRVRQSPDVHGLQAQRFVLLVAVSHHSFLHDRARILRKIIAPVKTQFRLHARERASWNDLMDEDTERGKNVEARVVYPADASDSPSILSAARSTATGNARSRHPFRSPL
jgi:hypothetical protein